MRKITVMLILFIFAGVSQACAHPPYDIKISFNVNTKILQAVIMHNVANPLNHSIRKVDIGLNGKEIIEHNISRQDNNDSQSVSYLIPDVKDGDTLSVEGYCSISGVLKKEIRVKIKK